MFGSIYKLTNTLNEKYYVGSTKKSLNNRLAKHKARSKQPNCYFHRYFDEIVLQGGRWNISEIEQVSGHEKDLLLAENNHIKLDDPLCLNRKRAYGIRRCDYETDREYERAKYLDRIDFERNRNKIRWQRLKNDPELMERHREKQRRNYRLRMERRRAQSN